jgi:purine-nucleoside phosphorylase
VTEPAIPGPDDTFAEEGVALIRQRTPLVPQVAIVLGSGLGEAVANDVEPEREFSYQTLPGFPPSSVPGHAGRLVMGRLYGVPAAVFLGRVHFYEGHGIGAATLIPRLAAGLGAKSLVLTNAAGGLAPSLKRGRLMLIEDHLNFLGVNPLVGWSFPNGQPAFVGLAAAYDRDLLALAERAAQDEGIDVTRGVYVALPGPSFETPAETRFLAEAGAHAVGMSTVPETVAGVALGLHVLAISCITNTAGTEDTHEQVLAAAREATLHLRALISRIVPQLAGRGRDGGAVGTGGEGDEGGQAP